MPRSERYEGRLIAEAVRALEAGRGQAFEDPSADAAARVLAGSFEDKIVERARGIGHSTGLIAAIRQLRAVTRATAVIGLALAFGTGAATAHAALATEVGLPVNFHWAILVILGVETATLALWLVVTLFGSRVGASISLGGTINALGRRIAAWFHRDPQRLGLIQAAASVLAQGPGVKWILGILTHALWLTFLIGTLSLSLLTLSAKQVSFAWQTTILSEASYVPVTEAMAALPRAVGFATPTADQIRESRWTGVEVPATNISGAWAGLLVGAIVVYGIAPRSLLLLLCIVGRVRASARFRLDLSRPEYARLRERLMPTTHHEGVVDRDEGTSVRSLPPVLEIPTIEFDGAIALVRHELRHTDIDGQRRGVDQAWHDLGPVESRSDADRVVSALAERSPGLVLVATSSLTTPDRGVAAFFSVLRKATGVPIAILLCDGAALRDRFAVPDVAQRFEDWRLVADRAGIPGAQVIEYDIAAPSADDRARLARLLGTEAS